MEAIARSIQRLEQFARFTGHAVSWLSLALVLLAMLIVLLRYAFDFGSIGLQEAVMYLHGALFMLGLSYTLSRDEHVRVDIFYQRFSPAKQGLVDFFGTLFLLLPTCLLMFLLSWDYVIASWSRLEGSADPGGLPLVFALKTLLLVAPVLLVIQGTAEALRAWLRWKKPSLDAAVTARSEDNQ